MAARLSGLLIVLPGALISFGAIFILSGCTPAPQISQYTVPKPEMIETPVKAAGSTATSRPSAPRPQQPAPSTDSLTYDLPAGWKEIAPRPLTLKAFEVVDGEQRIEITISVAGGDLVGNMNRWRGQIGLPPVDDAEIEKALQSREINGLPGKFMEVHQAEDAPARQSILGIMIPEGEHAWFIKLRGHTSLAEREREQFESFAKSVKW